MDTTPNLNLPYLAAAQSQKHVTHNEAIRALDAVVQLAVTNRIQATPPAGPTEGQRFIVATAATGLWVGQDGRIAAWQDGAWAFYAPQAGWLVWIAAESALVVWTGTAWAAASANVNPAPLVGVNASADSTNRLAVKSPAVLFDNIGNGHQVKVNKAAATDTASVLLQTGYSGRAEIGLAGDDNLHVKVSPDGTSWTEALVIDRTTGALAHAPGARHTFQHSAATAGVQLKPAAGDPATPADGDLWYNATAASFRMRQNGTTSGLGGGAQVPADWSATTGAAAILNKPVLGSAAAQPLSAFDAAGTATAAATAATAALSAVARSGSYADLSNKPAIPAAQVQADWNATTGLAAILNKPALVSGAPGAAVQYDHDRGGLEVRPILPDYSNANVAKNADRSFSTGAAAGDCWFDLYLTAAQIAVGAAYITAKINAGALSLATYEQRNAGAVTVAAANLTLEGNRYVKRAIALNAATTFIRVRLQTTAAATFLAPAMGLGEPASAATDPNLPALDGLLSDAPNALTNLWPPAPTIQLTTGTIATRVSATYTFPAASVSNILLPLSGFALTDTWGVLFQLSAPAASVRVVPQLQGVSSGTAVPCQDLGNGWYGAMGPANGGTGGAADSMLLYIDTRTSNGYAAAPTVLTRPWVGKNPAGYPSVVSTPAVVSAAVAALLAGVAYVDTATGSDTANFGNRAAPFATIARALSAGARKIYLRANAPLRVGNAATFANAFTLTNIDQIEFIAYRETADTAERAQIWGSINYPAASFAAVSGSSNLFYLPLAYDPNGGIWENAAGVIARMAIPYALAGNTYAASQAAAQAGTPGSIWYGAGTAGTGLYIYPFGGTIIGKSYEVPMCNAIFAITNCAAVKFRDIEIAYAGGSCITATNAGLRTENCLLQRTGNSSASSGNCATTYAGVTWVDFGSRFTDGGDCGINTAFNTDLRCFGSDFSNNWRNGVAYHIATNAAPANGLFVGCTFNGNNKNGWISITAGNFRLVDCSATGNGGTDLGIDLAATSPTLIASLSLQACVADQFYNNNFASQPVGNLTVSAINLRGSFYAANAISTINGHVVRGNVTGKAVWGARHQGNGSLTIADFRYTGATYGVMLDTGTVSLSNGHILRSGGAAVYQASGTLTVSATDPVNQFANAAVSGGAITVAAGGFQSFNAI